MSQEAALARQLTKAMPTPTEMFPTNAIIAALRWRGGRETKLEGKGNRGLSSVKG